jgi:hypothetical protein
MDVQISNQWTCNAPMSKVNAVKPLFLASLGSQPRRGRLFFQQEEIKKSNIRL